VLAEPLQLLRLFETLWQPIDNLVRVAADRAVSALDQQRRREAERHQDRQRIPGVKAFAHDPVRHRFVAGGQLKLKWRGFPAEPPTIGAPWAAAWKNPSAYEFNRLQSANHGRPVAAAHNLSILTAAGPSEYWPFCRGMSIPSRHNGLHSANCSEWPSEF
jgi:hypothetical protein